MGRRDPYSPPYSNPRYGKGAPHETSTHPNWFVRTACFDCEHFGVRSSQSSVPQRFGLEHCVHQDETRDETAYLNYLAGPWKANQEASKKEGIILSYKVLTVEGHTPGEWNVMLMTEYKNLAAMEANEEKADALAQKVVGDDEKQRQGYRERLEIREVMGDRLAREIVLEPRSR